MRSASRACQVRVWSVWFFLGFCGDPKRVRQIKEDVRDQRSVAVCDPELYVEVASARTKRIMPC